MASFDTNKAGRGNWTVAGALGANVGRTVANPPSRVNMAVDNTLANDLSMTSSDNTPVVASNMDSAVLQNNTILDLLLLMYNTGNLPLPFPGNLTGPMSPFGLYTHFGLPVPPLPMLPQTSMTAIAPDNAATERRPMTAVGLSDYTIPSAISNAQILAQTSRLGRTTSRPEYPPNKQPGRQTLFKPGGNVAQNVRSSHVKRTVNGFSSAASSYPVTTLQAPAVLHRSAGPRIGNTYAGSGVGIRMCHTDSVSKIPTLSTGARCSRPSAKARAETLPSSVNGRIVGSYAARTVPIQNNRDYEEAALLLGLRNGRDVVETPIISASGRSSTMPSPTSARGGINSRHGLVEQKRSGSSVYSHAAAEQAVDLSTKPKLKSKDVREASIAPTLNNNTRLNSTPSSSQWPTTTLVRPKSVQSATNLSSGTRKKAKNDQQQHAQQHVVAASRISHASLQTPRPLLSPKRAKVDSTSVVSHLPSCICAFDRPSNIEGGANAARPGQDIVLQGQSNLPHSLHFKKAMCEKFSQAPSSTSVVYKDAVCQGGHGSGPNRNELVSYAGTDESLLRSAKAPPRSLPEARSPVLKTLSTAAGGSAHLSIDDGGSTSAAIASSIPERITSIANAGSNPGIAGQPVHIQPLQRVSKEPSTSTTCAAVTNVSATVVPSTARQSVPSFSELRQRSVELHRASATDVARGNPAGAKASGFGSKLPTSNLYRIRNSELGGSNDSLHSSRSEEDATKANVDDESDLRCSSSDSDTSNSDDSEFESDQEGPKTPDTFVNQVAKITASGSIGPSLSRPRFVLSRPKFTLTSSEVGLPASSISVTSPARNTSSKPGNVSTCSPGSKIKMKSPTFTFSSSGSGGAGGEAEIPELVCDEEEAQDSFKYKLIQALVDPGSKDGVAVNGKSLRELVGEADYFYHNNRKYILKRVRKPADDSISGATARKGFPLVKKSKKDANSSSKFSDRESPPKIEPRISVTARKLPEKEEKLATKNPKKIKKRHRRHHHYCSGDKKKFSSSAEARKRASLDAKAAKHSASRSKRRRRNHEIDNLVFEGAGGLTPMPDLSLRDNDVFSNIKLRRRKAARRGIAAEASPVKKADKLTRKSTLKTIKEQAYSRAIANKNRKRSIEKRLRKFQVKNRLPIVKKELEAAEIHPRTSCVRINAGVARPHLTVQSLVVDEDQKSRGNSIVGPHDGRQNDDDICTVTPQGKQTLSEQAQLSLTSHGAAAEYKSEPNCASAKSKVHVSVVEALRLENADQTARKVDRVSETAASSVELERYRRTSKRLFEQKQSVEKRAEPTRNDDETTTGDSDSVRSDSPFFPPSRGQQNRKRRRNTTSATKSGRPSAKSAKISRADAQFPRGNFSLMSLFSTPPALSLPATFGDLQPSYSVKVKRKRGTAAVSAWHVGSSALDTKHQLQRESWRNMTLDMFTNRIK